MRRREYGAYSFKEMRGDFGVTKKLYCDEPVRLTRSLLISGLLIGLLLAWPLLLLGRPAYLGDSAAYFKGGRAAVDFVVVRFVPPSQHSVVGTSSGLPTVQSGGAGTQSRGARSISYSVLSYLLSAPRAQLVLLAIMQAVLTGLVSVIVLNFYSPATRARQLATGALLAFATPVAFVACLAVPDIFTGLMVIAIILPAVGAERMSQATKLLLAATGIFGVAAHSSHPPLAAGLTLIVTIWLLNAWRRGERPAARAWLWASAPLVFGVVLTVTANLIGFGDASIAAKRFPLTLARSVADGPGRWYLEKHCAIEHFAICEVYPHGFPDTVPGFLWGKSGVGERATPQQMDRIRAEEIPIVAAATREYLGIELLHLSTSFVQQLVNIRPEAMFDQHVVVDASGTPRLEPAIGLAPWVGLVFQRISLVAALAGLLWMGRKFPTFTKTQRAAILLTIAALLINAAICVYFSGVANRYQARVIWLIPLLALSLAGSGHRQMAGSAPESEPGCD